MKRIVCFLIFGVVISGCSSEKKPKENLKIITVDTSTVGGRVDISGLFDNDIEIIKLESTKECLVSAGDNIIVAPDYITISDKISKKISMFDREGRFLKNIGMVGRGPGEYIRLGDFSVMGDSVYVQDASQAKIVIYPINGGQNRELILDPPIFYDALITYDNKLYLATNYCNNYNLIGINSQNNGRIEHLPYDKKIEDMQLAWGIEKHYGQYKDSILLIYGRNDTIFNLVRDEVHPMYVTDFIRNKIPSDLSDKKNTEVYMTAIDKGYTLGLSKISNTRDYIIGNFGEGSKNFDFFYAKSTGDVLLSDYFIFQDLGGLPMMSYYTTNDSNEFIAVYNATTFKTIYDKVIKKDEIKNPENRKKIDTVAESLDDNDNPVIIVFKFKDKPVL